MRGDREAFGVLVVHTSDRLYAIATRILRDTELAEDALQGALLTAWRQLPTLRDPDRFDAWVRRLLVHACYAEARRQPGVGGERAGPAGRRAGGTRRHRFPSSIATRSTGRSDA